MKKLLTITLIMLITFSLVLVSCSNNPAEDKKEEVTKEQDISETELQVLGKKYSPLSSNIALLISAVDKDSSEYKEERTVAVTSSKEEGFSLLTDEEKAKYNEEKGETAGADTESGSSSAGSAIIDSIAEYTSVTLSANYTNVDDGDNYKLSLSSLVLTLKLSEGEPQVYGHDGIKIADSSLMKEYQALLELYKPTTEDLSFDISSELMKKFISLVKEYSPQFKVNITFGSMSAGKLEADVVLGIDGDGKILVNVKSATVSVSDKILFTTENAAFKVTLGSDFNLKLHLNASSDSSSLYVSFSDMAVSGGVTVDFDGVTVKSPYDDKNDFEFVIGGTISYNFTTNDTKADVEISDKANIDVSGISQYLPQGVTLPSLGVTVAFTYDGKFILPDSIEALNLEYFNSFISNFRITKFMIGNLPITTDSINKLIQDNCEKIYAYIGRVLQSYEDGGEGESSTRED